MAITTVLDGGLGNQMFQYATGYAVAASKGTELYLDISNYSRSETRRFSLDSYNIDAQINDSSTSNGSLIRRLTRVRKSMHEYKELETSFDPNVFHVKDGTILRGYWQSEKYFIKYQSIIRKQLTYKLKIPVKWQKDTAFINKSSCPVSIHIRRGDYVSNPLASKVLGALDTGYYLTAMRKMKHKYPHSTFIIFSDDLEWVRHNLPMPQSLTRFVDTGSDMGDFEVMRSCSHHIIANSSFSWWAAWLNQSKQKHVIAPAHWFKDPQFQSKDIVPNTWETV